MIWTHNIGNKWRCKIAKVQWGFIVKVQWGFIVKVQWGFIVRGKNCKCKT